MPFHYWMGGDVLIECAWTKSIGENGWFLHNPRVGAPYGLDFYDFPVTDTLHFAAMRLLLLFTPSWGMVLNLYYLGGFVLAAVTAAFAFRALGACSTVAVPGAVLFAFAPYHFGRGQAHLQLSSYYLVPLTVLVMLWIQRGERLIDVRSGRGLVRCLAFTKRGAVAAVIFFILAGSGVYYAFFAVTLVGASAAFSFFEHRDWRRTLAAASLIAITAVTMAISLVPNAAYIARHGANPDGITRSLSDPEVYGLRIIQMLLPVSGHRVEWLAAKKQTYNANAVLVNENDTAALGTAGAVGFGLLLVISLTGSPVRRHSETLLALARLNLAAVLLGTMGGLGSVFSLFIGGTIRGYNRLSIFILFLSLTALILLLDCLWRRSESSVVRAVLRFGLTAFLLLGIYDQIGAARQPNPEAERAFKRDAGFFGEVESRLPAHALIVQFPYAKFPESPVIQRMEAYDHFRAYLHTRTLRGTFGAMRGRHGDIWLAQTLARPLKEALPTMAAAGMSGVVVDRFGYADSGAAVEKELAALLQTAPLVSSDGRFAFYDARLFSDLVRTSVADEKSTQEPASHPVVLRWSDDFSGLEADTVRTWRWCGYHGGLLLENGSKHTRRICIRFKLFLPSASTSVRIEGLGTQETCTADVPRRVPVERELDLPPGRHTLSFIGTGARVPAPGDPRTIVFAVEDFGASVVPFGGGALPVIVQAN
ncbi:MAG: hypothetical protein ACE14M_16520 [Terriglobales bacterium]